jgi:hypothetical protein
LTTIAIANDPKRVLSRLTRAQFLNSVAALLGPEALAGVAELVPVSVPNGGYGNSGFAQSQAYDVVLGFDTAARKIAENVTDFSSLHERYGGCSELACADTFIRSVLSAAFRRPATDEEVAALQPVVTAAQEDGLSYEQTEGMLLRAILQAPEFLYLFEDDGLTDYQLATRLAYFLTDAPPDAELQAAAAEQTLRSPEVLGAHVERLLTSSGGAFAKAFAYDFLGLRRAYQRTLDLEPAVIDQLVASATDTFARLVTDDEEVGALFTTQQFVVNAETASFLGAAASDDAILRSDDTLSFQGLLTHPAVLMAISNAVEGSTVSRGQFIAHQLLCVPPTPPPSADLIAQELADDLLPENPTQRDEAEARLRAASCKGCHLQFEPYAFGLNKWGGDGHYKDDPRLSDSGPITTSLGSFEFTDYQSYLPLLAESEQFRRCITDHFLRYSLRHTAYPASALDAVLSTATTSDKRLTFRGLAKAVALQPEFLER